MLNRVTKFIPVLLCILFSLKTHASQPEAPVLSLKEIQAVTENYLSEASEIDIQDYNLVHISFEHFSFYRESRWTLGYKLIQSKSGKTAMHRNFMVYVSNQMKPRFELKQGL